MERYSFLKFINVKEKTIKKKIKFLENQIGSGDTIELKTIQMEILKLKKMLESIGKRKVDTLIDPYDNLKGLIDSINASVKQLDGEVKQLNDETAESKKQEILNKIKDIEVVLDSDPSDYTKIIAKSKLSYVGEAINPEQVDIILKKYISDSEAIIEDIKKQIGGEDGKLIKNSQFKQIIDTIESKMSEYKTSLGKFLSLKDNLEKYIKEMESVYTTVEIDLATQPINPGSESIVINVDAIDEAAGPELNPDDEMFRVAETAEDIEKLIDTQFLHKPKKPVDAEPKPEEGKSGEERKYLKVKNKYYSGFEKEKITKSIEDVDETIIKLHSEWLKTLSDHKKDLEKKSIKLDIIARNKSKLLSIKTNIKKNILDKNVINTNTNLIALLDDIEKQLEYYVNAEKPEELEKDSQITSIPDDFGIDKLSLIKEDIIKEFTSMGLSTKFDNLSIKKHLVTLYDSIKYKISGSSGAAPGNILERLEAIKGNAKIKDEEVIRLYLKFKLISLLDEIIRTNRIDRKYLFVLNKLTGGGDVGEEKDGELDESEEERTLQDLILKLSEYEKLVRDIKSLNINLNKIIKLYNIRYSQFFNFQKYIVNYVSIKVAKGGYSYYQYMSKGTISFFDSLLTGLTNILDKYNRFSGLSPSDLKVLSQQDKKWFYGKHYFMIKILQSFFNKLYLFWDTNEASDNPDIKKKWELTNQIKTDEKIDERDSENNKYFFLFNIFQDILMEYHMSLPAVANYIRINKIRDEDYLETFKKGSKNKLDLTSLQQCIQEDANKNAESISQIKFEEVFDPNNFRENDNLSLYMGLSSFINKGKSIMILTYGYSGVGKSFTLFGGRGKAGMLQSTLNTLGSGIEIGVKMFELYGLGVPYKFYWDNPELFCHFIYNYKFESSEKMNVYQKNKSQFAAFLDLKNNDNYQNLTKEDIDNFGNFVTKIDDIRKETGRIKATLNNPESSRSIMIYDFRIKLRKPIKNSDGSIKEYSNFVVMDLPGKENLYQTYCDSLDPNFDIKDNFKNYKLIKSISSARGNRLESTFLPKTYDDKLLRSMVYINPLWLSMIPEIAEHFDLPGNENKNIDIDKINIRIPVRMLLTTGFTTEDKCKNEVNSKESVAEFQKIMDKRGKTLENMNILDLTCENGEKRKGFHDFFNQVDESILHHQYQYFKNSLGKSKTKAELTFVEQNYLGLMGMSERALHNTVNMIKNGNLLELGNKLNDMIKDDDKRNKKYGFAGLEGIYINENILGLLQVLANRVIQIKKNDINATIDVVCEQQEIYKSKSRSKLVPLGDKTLDRKDDGNKVLQDDEFFCQVDFLNQFQHENFPKDNVSTSFADDIYDNIFRNDKYKSYTYKDKNVVDWITSYDYNKIFNIKNPPIKEVLGPYLSSIDNFYLFFVVSNNKKVKDGASVETCDKQMKLLYDTRKFMEVVAEDDPRTIQCEI